MVKNGWSIRFSDMYNLYQTTCPTPLCPGEDTTVTVAVYHIMDTSTRTTIDPLNVSVNGN